MFSFQQYPSPAGDIYIAGDENTLFAVVFAQQWQSLQARLEIYGKKQTPVLRETEQQLTEYFQGERQTFDLPYNMQGTEFQVQVWSALQAIPFGQTLSYKAQAQMINSPQAVRAVGTANGANRLCVVLPCHRVVGSKGDLCGYGGGLAAKKFLLQFERQLCIQSTVGCDFVSNCF